MSGAQKPGHDNQSKMMTKLTLDYGTIISPDRSWSSNQDQKLARPKRAKMGPRPFPFQLAKHMTKTTKTTESMPTKSPNEEKFTRKMKFITKQEITVDSFALATADAALGLISDDGVADVSKLEGLDHILRGSKIVSRQ